MLRSLYRAYVELQGKIPWRSITAASCSFSERTHWLHSVSPLVPPLKPWAANACLRDRQVEQQERRLKELAPAVRNMEQLAAQFSDEPEQILPESGPLESAKSYREKKAKPLLAQIVKVLRSLYRAYVDSRRFASSTTRSTSSGPKARLTRSKSATVPHRALFSVKAKKQGQVEQQERRLKELAPAVRNMERWPSSLSALMSSLFPTCRMISWNGFSCLLERIFS